MNTSSALISRYVTTNAEIIAKKHKPTDVKRGGPRL
jgi:hypothetical protein